MLSLVIDTATPNMYVAVGNEKLIDEIYLKNIKNHSEHLMLEIIKLLEKNNIDKHDLTQIVVGVGPGSYTGVRIGVVVAKMLSYSLNIDLYEISSLYIQGSSYDSFSSIIDARRGNVFAGIFENGKCEYEGHINLEEFKKIAKNNLIDENSYKANYENIIKYAKKTDCNKCVPNYLRETEAVRNLW